MLLHLCGLFLCVVFHCLIPTLSVSKKVQALRAGLTCRTPDETRKQCVTKLMLMCLTLLQIFHRMWHWKISKSISICKNMDKSLAAPCSWPI